MSCSNSCKESSVICFCIAGIRIFKKNYTWTPWLKLPGPCTWLLILTLALNLCLRSAEKQGQAHLCSLLFCFPYTDKSIQLCCTSELPHSLLLILLFSVHTQERYFISIIKERAKRHRDICFRRLTCHSGITSDRWPGEETWGCLVLLNSTLIQISCLQMCEGDYRT